MYHNVQSCVQVGGATSAPIVPDHIAETDKYEYLGTMFHRDRTWATQFKEAAKKFWGPASDKWMDSGALRIGAGERVTTVLWNTMVAPAMEYDPLVTISAYANQSTQKVMAPVEAATKAARQAATAGREHCDSAARMATGIHDAMRQSASPAMHTPSPVAWSLVSRSLMN